MSNVSKEVKEVIVAENGVEETLDLELKNMTTEELEAALAEADKAKGVVNTVKEKVSKGITKTKAGVKKHRGKIGFLAGVAVTALGAMALDKKDQKVIDAEFTVKEAEEPTYENVDVDVTTEENVEVSE